MAQPSATTDPKSAQLYFPPKGGLRDSYASYRLAATHDAAEISLELGNSPQIVFAYDRKLVSEKQSEKWFSMNPTPLAL